MRMEFKAAVEQRQREDAGEPNVIETTIVGTKKIAANDNHLYIIEQPDPALFSIVVAAAATASTDADRAESIWNYFRGTMSQADFVHLRNRVISDRDVDLDLLMQVIEGTIEVFGNFPTQPPSDSSPSSTPTGPSSLGRAPGPGSTYSDSPRPGF